MNNSEKYNGHANWETFIFLAYNEREPFDNDIETIINSTQKTDYLTTEENQIYKFQEFLKEYNESYIDELNLEGMLKELLISCHQIINFKEIATNWIQSFKKDKELI